MTMVLSAILLILQQQQKRYSPIIAYLLVPNVYFPQWGKCFFSVMDILTAVVFHRILMLVYGAKKKDDVENGDNVEDNVEDNVDRVDFSAGEDKCSVGEDDDISPTTQKKWVYNNFNIIIIIIIII